MTASVYGAPGRICICSDQRAINHAKFGLDNFVDAAGMSLGYLGKCSRTHVTRKVRQGNGGIATASFALTNLGGSGVHTVVTHRQSVISSRCLLHEEHGRDPTGNPTHSLFCTYLISSRRFTVQLGEAFLVHKCCLFAVAPLVDEQPARSQYNRNS